MKVAIVSLGMLTIDDIEFAPGSSQSTRSLTRVLGGAGTYAVVGARLFATPETAKQIGWVVHVGHDFPTGIRDEIDSWGLYTKYIDTPDRPTTRAKNTYSGEFRGFEFVTPKIQVDHTMLDDRMLSAEIFHIIGTPKRCIDLVEGILDRRQEIWGQSGKARTLARPHFVWEPMEHNCSPSNIDQFMRALSHVDTFSPNEDEFAKLWGLPLTSDGGITLVDAGRVCQTMLTTCKFEAVVIRLGARGALVAQREGQKNQWLPAYYQASSEGGTHPKVVDVTGGGNAFMGAFCVGLIIANPVEGCTRHESAAMFGAVAASFAIEQVGMTMINIRTGEKKGFANTRLDEYVKLVESLS